MNEGSFFKFNQTEVAPITPEEELSEELAAEGDKLEANLKGLNDDIEELGGEEELKSALEKKPHIMASIAGRAAIIAPILIAINTIFSGSFSEAIRAEDTADIVRFISVIVGGSAAISAFIEAGKLLKKETF